MLHAIGSRPVLSTVAVPVASWSATDFSGVVAPIAAGSKASPRFSVFLDFTRSMLRKTVMDNLAATLGQLSGTELNPGAGDARRRRAPPRGPRCQGEGIGSGRHGRPGDDESLRADMKIKERSWYSS